MGAYLESIDTLAVVSPVVVDVETDQAQDCEVEEDLPAGHDAAMAVHPSTPTFDQAVLVVVNMAATNDRSQQLMDPGVLVTTGQLIREEYADVKCPCCSNHVLPRQLGGDAVVQIQDSHDLER